MSAHPFWIDLMRTARQQEGYVDQTGRICHEVRNVLLAVRTLDEAKAPLEAIRSVGWYYPSDEELKSIILGTDMQHLYTYSAQVSSQLPRLIDLLRREPGTRRAVLDFVPDAYTPNEYMPSLVYVYLRLQHGKLFFTVHARSVDLLVGLPANLFQMAVLCEYVADSLGVQVGEIAVFMNSAHVFSSDDAVLERFMK